MLWGLLLVIPIVIAGLVGWTAYVTRGVERMVPRDGETVDAGGVRFHYHDFGPKDAPAIVMVHGILSSWRVFTYALAPSMARDHRIIVIDRPGWGYSLTTGGPLSLAAQATAIAALIEKLELNKPLLVGHSMGGAVSMALAVHHPEAVRGVALIAPLTQPIDQPADLFKSYLLPKALWGPISHTLAVPFAIRASKERSAAAFAPDLLADDYGVRGGGMLAIRPSSFRNCCFELNTARAAMMEQAPRYSEIKLPVAILFGRGDALLDPQLHGVKTAEQVPGATIEMVEGGHMLPVMHAELTEAWLRRFSGS